MPVTEWYMLNRWQRGTRRSKWWILTSFYNSILRTLLKGEEENFPTLAKTGMGSPDFCLWRCHEHKSVANNSVHDHYSRSWTSKWGSRARKPKQNLILHDHDKWSRTVKFCSWPQSMVMNQIIFFMTILIGHEPNKLLHDQELRLWTHGMS